MKLKRLFSGYVGISILLLSYLAQAEEGIVSTQANMQIRIAPNNVPVINIAMPNDQGISHNCYQHFNVPRQGMILNNAHETVHTQLAGQVAPNPNLTTQAAALIINEVTQANSSQLHGMLEVAGQATTVLVANPWGISCNGCGFINTRYAVLTTGSPQFDSHGNLTHYQIEGGHVTIEGQGLNAKSSDYLAIMTRVLTVNAQIHANDLQLILGTNHIEATTGRVTAIPVREQAIFSYALDVSHLGGMYTRKIRLIGTEQGLGVNYTGILQVKDRIIINHLGDIIFKGAAVHTDDFTLVIPEDLPYKLYNSGVIKASQANMVADKIVNTLRGKIEANVLELNTTSLRNIGHIQVGEYAKINTDEVVMHGALRGTGEIQLYVKHGYDNAQNLVTAPKLTIAESLAQGTAFLERVKRAATNRIAEPARVEATRAEGIGATGQT